MLSRHFNKLNRVNTMTAARAFANPTAQPNDEPAKRVLISGAAGQIAYSIVFRIAR